MADNSKPAFPTLLISLSAETVAEAMEAGGESRVEELTETLGSQGLSLRDHFASEALSGLASEKQVDISNGGKKVDKKARRIAKEAYKIADAMLEERGEE